MIDYAAIRHRVKGPCACLPVFYREDLAVDYPSLERYARWLVDAGIECVCLTHGYSQLGYVDEQENLQLTRLFAEAVGDRAVFFASTRGELPEALAVTEALYGAGADGVFVVPPFAIGNSGPHYVRFLLELFRQTEVPILLNAYPTPANPAQPMIATADYEALVAHEQFIGLKEDVNVPMHRMALIDRYGDRLAMIGGGLIRNYMQFYHYPCQSELHGFFNPRRALRFTGDLAAGRLREALEWIEAWELACSACGPGLEMLPRNQVIMYALGFARTWRLRCPQVVATAEQAEQTIDFVRQHPEIFEAVGDTAR